MQKTRNAFLDQYAIQWVPDHARRGKPFQQFILWFSTSLQITAIVDGALAVVFGVPAITAIWGLLAGNLLGGIVMALHAAQGPRLGLPQMISSRVQFGVKGAALPLLLAIFMYLGFATTGAALSGQAINRILGVDHAAIGILIFGLGTVLIASAGYHVIHLMSRLASVLSIFGFGYLFWKLLGNHSYAELLPPQTGSIAQFLLAMSLSAAWQLTLAPYVADYSRYLPADTKGSRVFWPALLGTVLSSQISMSFGVMLAGTGASFLKNQVGVLGDLVEPNLAILIFIVIVAGKLAANSLNAYGGYMCLLTIVTGMRGGMPHKLLSRHLVVPLFIACTMMLAIFASPDLLNHFKNFVLLILVAFVPWSAINLIDFYLISRERVDIPALYQPSGRYGAYNAAALSSYCIGVLVQIPFLNQSFYKGYFVDLLGGTDLSWVAGLLVAAIVYYPWARRSLKVPEQMIYPATAAQTDNPPA